MQEERHLDIEQLENTEIVFGIADENIRLIEEAFDVKIMPRNDNITIMGEDTNISKAEIVVRKLFDLAAQKEPISRQGISYFIDMTAEGQAAFVGEFNPDVLCVTTRGKQIKAKTLGQKKYIEALKKNTIVFGIGPAGTGKTYLAVACAVTAFRNKEVSKIILTRPAVEAGEKLGFLPGDLQNKVDPYLRPLYDALFDIMGAESFSRNFEKGVIEVAPLAYMRGRTLDDSYIILDEAQNTTSEQMKMFLTRIGFGSKVIITGDITQIDLPGDKKSGLKESAKVLQNIADIEFIYLTEKDVVRHALVQKIVKAYETYDQIKEKSKEQRQEQRHIQRRQYYRPQN